MTYADDIDSALRIAMQAAADAGIDWANEETGCYPGNPALALAQIAGLLGVDDAWSALEMLPMRIPNTHGAHSKP